MKNNKGFSLVELIVVIAIMAILAAIAIPTFATFINKANVASDVSLINDIEYSAKLAHTATGDKVSTLVVAVDGNGNVATVSYKLLDVDNNDAEIGTVTIQKVGTEWKATDNVSENDDLADDAKAVVENIDWTYKFKSTKKAGNWTFDTTNNEWKFTAN